MQVFNQCWLDNRNISGLEERDRRCEMGPEMEGLARKYSNFGNLEEHILEERKKKGSDINILFGQMALNCGDIEVVDIKRDTTPEADLVKEMDQISECYQSLFEEFINEWGCS